MALETTSEMQGGTFLLREEGLSVVVLRGTPSEMGWQHGTNLREEICTLRSKFVTYLSGLRKGLGGRILYWILLFLARRMNRYISEPIRIEMASVAKAAKVPYGFILLINVLDDLFNTLACSSFAISGEMAKDTTLLYGRNLDYALFTDIMPRLNTVFAYKPKQGYPFISIAWPGYVGCVTGMNDRGLVLSGLASNTFDKTRKGIPTGIIYRQALQHAASLIDLKEIIALGPRTIGNNVLLASHDEAIVLEVSAKRWERRLSENGMITVTNHYQTAPMSSIQAPFISKPRSSPLPDNCFTQDYSVFRDEQLRRLRAKGPLGVNEVIETLRTEGVANPGTVQSAVFSPQEKTFWVAKRLETPVSLGEFVKLEDLL